MNMKTFLAGMATGATVMGFVSLVVTRKSKAVDKAASDASTAASEATQAAADLKQAVDDLAAQAEQSADADAKLDEAMQRMRAADRKA